MEEMLRLVRQGLHADNLRRLIVLCGESFERQPVIYGTLPLLLEPLADEYEGQSIPGSRALEVNERLQPCLISLLEAERASPEDILIRLAEVLRAFRSL